MLEILEKFLDRHHAWRSLDPTLAISTTFVKKEKKSIQPPFFFLLYLFFLFKKMHFLNLYNLTEHGLAWLNSAQPSSAWLSLAQLG